MDSVTCDVLVVGGSLGGVAAALSAARMGMRVWLIEETRWIGGQLTSQGVCTPDENAWIEVGGGTAAYRELRRQIRERYRMNYQLSPRCTGDPHFNPGNCWVSGLSVEPRIASGLLLQMLLGFPKITVGRGMRVSHVERADDHVTAVIVRDRAGGETRISAEYLLDATELGDILPLADVEHVVGAESRSETGEPDAPVEAKADWIQPFTFPFALELRPRGENHTIPPPLDYAELKALQQYHILDGAMDGMFASPLSWWTYRRIIAAENFRDPVFRYDIAMINTGSNDFKGGVIPTGSRESDADALARARQASLGYVYWLQTECPREDDPTRRGYPELKLRTDIFDTSDAIAPMPYIRESRRIKAMKTIVEQEIVAADRSGAEHQSGPRAAFFSDSCGIGHYALDIHEGGTPEPGYFLPTKPFQIPLGALIPIRVRNLLPACKNIGTTHLTNGAYRLHPIEWGIGEAAGALAGFCIHNRVKPHEALLSRDKLRAYQDELLSFGIPIFWWGDVAPENPAFRAIQRLSMDGIWPGGPDVLFRPDERFTGEAAADIESRIGKQIAWPAVDMTRAEAAVWLHESTKEEEGV